MIFSNSVSINPFDMNQLLFFMGVINKCTKLSDNNLRLTEVFHLEISAYVLNITEKWNGNDFSIRQNRFRILRSAIRGIIRFDYIELS